MDINFKSQVHEAIIEDKISKNRSLYDAGFAEIFWKNFLAGFSRAIGSIFIYIIFLVILYFVLMKYVYPQVMPYINKIMDMVETAGKIQQQIPSGFSIPQSLFPGK